MVKAGIIGEDNILFELKNSGMDMVVLHDLYIESVSGASAQIDFLVLTPKINFASVEILNTEFHISGICRCSRNEGAKMTAKSLPHGRITCLRTFLGA